MALKRNYLVDRDISFEGSFRSTEDEKERLALNTGNSNRHDENLITSHYFYCRKTGELLGRTLSSWAILFVYSLLFCCCLTVLWGLCLWTFYQTLDNYTPKLLGSSGSFIGSNPALGYKPMRRIEDPYSSLIWFRHGGAGNYDELKRNIDKYLDEYEPGYWANAGASQTKCDWSTPPLHKDVACEFNKEWLSDINSDIKCISEESYGYYHGKPCILLKLNRIYGWQPQPYFNVTEVMSLPTMPKSLKEYIQKTWKDNCFGRGSDIEERCPQLNMVWIDCDGENSSDRENIGSISYTPWRGFPAYFFPYWNQIGYLAPIVMVQLKNPAPGVLMNIECRAWAKGLEHDRDRKRGLVHFEFLMD